MARHFADTVDKKRVNSCVLKHLFFPDVLLMSRFQNFAADAAIKNSAVFLKTTLHAVLLNKLIHELIRINLGPKILRTYFFHCLGLSCRHIDNNSVTSGMHTSSGQQCDGLQKPT